MGGEAWLAVGTIALPQCAVALGWVAYWWLGEPASAEAAPAFDRLGGIDVVVPSSGAPAADLFTDLQDVRARGARVVLLDTSDARPSRMGEAPAAEEAAPLDAAPGFRVAERGFGTHCWGPPPPGYKAGALNVWMGASEAEIVIVLDEDWRVEATALQGLAGALRGRPEAAFAQGCWGFEPSGEAVVEAADRASLRLHHRVEQARRSAAGVPFNLNGSFMALRREAVMAVGGFDGRCLSEDVDLAYRLARRGRAGVYVSGVAAMGQVVADVASYRDQKVRWAAGRDQALRIHGPAILARGPLLHRLLGLHYLLEYATSASALALAAAATWPAAPRGARLCALIAAALPGALRLHATVRHGGARADPVPVGAAAAADLALRCLVAGTTAALLPLALAGWDPGWRPTRARPLMIGASLAMLAVGALALPASDGIGWIGRAIWVLAAASSAALWAWPRPRGARHGERAPR